MKLSEYYPCEYLEDVFTIDYKQLYDIGIRGLIFDIDNTLVPHGKPCEAHVEQLFKKLHNMGFVTLLLSNNSKQRVETFNATLNSMYIYDAEKPSLIAFQKAVQKMQLPLSEVIVIGDQIFTDVCGANRAGLKTILIKYIGYYQKEWKGFKRYLEHIVLLTYKLRKKYHNRIFLNH